MKEHIFNRVAQPVLYNTALFMGNTMLTLWLVTLHVRSDIIEGNHWRMKEDSAELDPLWRDLYNMEITPMVEAGSIFLEKRANEMYFSCPLSLKNTHTQTETDAFSARAYCTRINCSYKSRDTTAWIIVVMSPLQGHSDHNLRNQRVWIIQGHGEMGLWEWTCCSGMRGIHMTYIFQD